MAQSTRNRRVAVVVEAEEGVLNKPTSADDYLASQDDFSLEPAFETLETAELKGSIGASKPIQGVEAPVSSFSHYLRHSGVEGQAPDFADLLQALFGTEAIRANERDTVAASTVSAINVDAAEGLEFQRGDALLFKDAVNGFSIRPIKSVAVDVLTPGFNLPNAPASGVNLGKSVSYIPANTAHQTLSLWEYIGNGGAISGLAGCRVTEMGITIDAGQLINAAYSLEGISSYFDPFIIAATNKFIDFDDAGGEENVAVAEGSYKDPHALAAAIETAIEGATADDITVTYSDTTGKFTLASDGGTFELLWKTGVNGSDNTDFHIGTLIGFDDSADDTLAVTYTADNEIDLTSTHTPSFDDTDPLAAKSNRMMIGDVDDNVCFAASTASITISTPKTNVNSICAESGVSGSVINERTVSISVTALLEQYDTDKWRRFRENEETSFMFIGGTKTGGNWDAGKCFCLYVPTAVVSAFSTADEDGLVAINIELTAYVNADGEGEVYLSFV